MRLQSPLKFKNYDVYVDKTSNTYREIWVYVNFIPVFGRNTFILAVSSTNKTDRHDITEILFIVALNTITLTPT